MKQRPDSSDFASLFLADTPLMDVRAPVEFAKGAFPAAVNRPLMDDKEREAVGIRYKQAGQDAAIALGHELVNGEIKQQRLQGWLDFARQNPEGYLYCFRGGLRSRTVQNWLREAGCHYPLVEGGYKAMRRFLLQTLEKPAPMLRLAGQTGTGKTELLKQLMAEGHPGIDLEGLANHKGSSFGRSPDDHQPTPINFENALAIDWLKARHAIKNRPGVPILVEDEGRAIGRLAQPLGFFDHFRTQPLIILTAPFEERVNRIHAEYVLQQGQAYRRLYGQQGPEKHRQAMLAALDRIRKRLGGARHQSIRDSMSQAFQKDSDILHRRWISALLRDYYDPMYAYQLSRKDSPVLLTASAKEIRDFLNQNFEALT